MNLIFLPFAGGSQYSYVSFNEHLKRRGLSIIPIEIPGRGSRFHEKLFSDVYNVVDDIYSQIKGKLTEPYAIYGHSMGTLLGYLLTHKILKEKVSPPVHLFFSGCGGPSVKVDEPPKHNLPKKEFIDKLIEMGGCPEEILQNSELMDIFEPIIRADFKLIEYYRYEPLPAFNIPISVLIGTEEKTTLDDALAWQKETSDPLEVFQLPGNHFFIFGQEKQLINIIADKLLGKLIQ